MTMSKSSNHGRSTHGSGWSSIKDIVTRFRGSRRMSYASSRTMAASTDGRRAAHPSSVLSR